MTTRALFRCLLSAGVFCCGRLFRKPAFAAVCTLACIALLATLGHTASAQTPISFPGLTPLGTSVTLTVSVAITGTGTAADPIAVTQGVTGEDFSVVPSSAGDSCTSGTGYLPGNSCKVTVVFKPKTPGVRAGAVVVETSDKVLLGSTPLVGTGQGSLAVLQPGRIDTVAGNGDWTYRGDNVAATLAPIYLPTGVVVDAGGNIYLSDSTNNRVRRVDFVNGMITTVAGNGVAGTLVDSGIATKIPVSSPAGLALDGAGNLYFADTNNNAIRRVDAVSGIMTTVVNKLGAAGYDGDGFAAVDAKLYLPEGLTFDAAGNLYIADTGNNVIREVDAVSGKITTIAGTGVAGYNKDGIAATTAQLNEPWSVAIALDGSILIADLNNNRIRMIDSKGIISTLAGTGDRGFKGDKGLATAAVLNEPAAVVSDPAGNLYIADSGNNRIRKISASSGKINTVTGDGSETFGGDTGPADKASIYGPYALFYDNTGNLYIADMFHNRIRKISGTTLALEYATIRVSKVSPAQTVLLENDGNADLDFAAPVLVNAALGDSPTACTTTPVISDASCTLDVEFAPTVVGDPVLGSVTMNSDAGNSPIVISLSGEVLTVEPTSVVVTSSSNPSLLNAAVTFTATVSSADTGRTGTVTFLDGSTILCNNVTLGASGTASCKVAALAPLGQHTITANYSGDDNNASAVSQPYAQIVQQVSTVALVVTTNPAIVTTSVLLAVTVSAPTGTPTGSVTFFDGKTSIGTADLVAGVASMSTVNLTPGTHNITVKYGGDTTDAIGTSNLVAEVISQGDTATALVSSNKNPVYGVSITLTATVTSKNGLKPSGTVQFLEGTTLLGTGTINAGVATATLSSLDPGSHTIVATYQGDTDDAKSTSNSVIEVVPQIATGTVLTSDPTTAAAGAIVHLTAKVSVPPGTTADGAITGSVNFNYGSELLGSGVVGSGGVATISVSTLPVGTDSITATYIGDNNYLPSTSSAAVETITLATSSLTLSGPSTVVVGAPASFPATLIATGAVPTGSLTLQEGKNVITVLPVGVAGVYTFSTSGLSLGTHVLTASYSGDANYGTSASNSITVTVQQATTSTSLKSSLNPQIVGQSVTFTANVISDGQNITGTVSLMDGAASLGSAPVTGGVATFTLSSLAFGTHNLTAVYSGDTNHSLSTSPVLNQKIVQAATILLGASANPAIAGTSITFTAKLTGTASLMPTGVVTFLDGATPIGTGVVDATGSASFSTSSLSVATHSITASYPGDTNFSTATSTVLLETVQDSVTEVALSASANPATYGAALTLTAQVSTNGVAATGSVTFTDAGIMIGTTPLNGGAATLTLSTLSPGTHTIVANYGGDSQSGASISIPLTLSVKQTTLVAIASSANPSPTLSSIVLTASVTNSGVGVATGAISFTDGTTSLGTATLDASGRATLTVPSLLVGTHPIVASYAGDNANFAATSNTLEQVIQLRPTETTLTATSVDPDNLQEITLISVVRWTGDTTPTGTITFTSGSNIVGSAPIDSTGVATMTITVQSGSETIVATYGGDASYASSSSSATAITANPPTQFTLQADPPTVTVQTLQHSTVNLTITSLKGFSDTMELGCLGLPASATCTFSSTQVNLASGGVQKIQLVVDTGNPLGAGGQASNTHSTGTGALMAFLPGSLLVGFALWRKKRGLPILTVVALLLGMGAMLSATGCAGLHINGTPPGTYTFKVAATGTQTGANETQTMTLTVTQ